MRINFDDIFKRKKELSRFFTEGSYKFKLVEVVSRNFLENNTHSDWNSNNRNNILFWGDNFSVMAYLLNNGWAETIDLIYIDPPFFTGNVFRVKNKKGENTQLNLRGVDQLAYVDKWRGGLMTYLTYMYDRLFLMKELLAETGSLYIHLDWHISHYIKVLLDDIFGYDNFRREIIWNVGSVSGFKSKVEGWVRQHDVILYYTKSDEYTFNKQFLPYKEEYIKKMFRYVDENGRRYRKRRGGRQYLDESKGMPIGDVWNDIISFQTATQAHEYVNFETQKPEKLLARIVKASSNENDLVADFFLGSGTTIVVAEKLHRKWIGSDISKVAIYLTKKRLLRLNQQVEVKNERNKSYESYNPQPLLFNVFYGDFSINDYAKKGNEQWTKNLTLTFNIEIIQEHKTVTLTFSSISADFEKDGEHLSYATTCKPEIRQYLDYWAIDWNFNGNWFNNNWASFKIGKDKNITLDVQHQYEHSGKYTIKIEALDIFGNYGAREYQIVVKRD